MISQPSPASWRPASRLTGTFPGQLFHPGFASTQRYGPTAHALLVRALEIFSHSIDALRGARNIFSHSPPAAPVWILLKGMVNLLSGLLSARLVCQTRWRNTPSSQREQPPRFAVELSSPAGGRDGRFCRSDREGEARRWARGVTGTDEALRTGCRTWGPSSGHQLQRRPPRPGAPWHGADGVPGRPPRDHPRHLAT